MKFPQFFKSLKTRLVVSVYMLLIATLWAFAIYTNNYLRDHLEKLLGQQQQAIVTYVASEIEMDVEERFRSLDLVSKQITTRMIENPSELQQFLAVRVVFNQIFNGGVLVTRRDGVVVASTLAGVDRVGHDFSDRDHISAALRGEPTIGTAVHGRALKSALFGMAVPIRNMQGEVIGAFAGVTDLNKPNFLQNVAESKANRSGPEKSGAWISDISASMGDGSRRPTGAESNEKTSP